MDTLATVPTSCVGAMRPAACRTRHMCHDHSIEPLQETPMGYSKLEATRCCNPEVLNDRQSESLRVCAISGMACRST